MKFFIFTILIALSTASNIHRHDDTFIRNFHNFIIPESVEEFKESLPPVKERRISNGFPASGDSQFPFVADITIRWQVGPPTTYCTGSLLSTNYIITGRGCIYNEATGQKGSSILTELGSSTRAGSRVSSFGVWAVWMTAASPPHPGFSILRIAQHLTLGPNIQTIRLPSVLDNQNWWEMRTSYIAGWGDIGPGIRATILQWADVTTTSRIECQMAATGLTRFEICVRPNQLLNTNIETGDIGAPLFLHEEGSGMGPPTLIGMISGSGFLSGSRVFGATQLGQFMTFILDVTGIPPRF